VPRCSRPGFSDVDMVADVLDLLAEHGVNVRDPGAPLPLNCRVCALRAKPLTGSSNHATAIGALFLEGAAKNAKCELLEVLLDRGAHLPSCAAQSRRGLAVWDG
jgi:hypothetical protein